MTIPVPDSLIQITLFLGALTFMYMSAQDRQATPHTERGSSTR